MIRLTALEIQRHSSRLLGPRWKLECEPVRFASQLCGAPLPDVMSYAGRHPYWHAFPCSRSRLVSDHAHGRTVRDPGIGYLLFDPFIQLSAARSACPCEGRLRHTKRS